jgi:hypothetical protein
VYTAEMDWILLKLSPLGLATVEPMTLNEEILSQTRNDLFINFGHSLKI